MRRAASTKPVFPGPTQTADMIWWCFGRGSALGQQQFAFCRQIIDFAKRIEVERVFTPAMATEMRGTSRAVFSTTDNGR